MNNETNEEFITLNLNEVKDIKCWCWGCHQGFDPSEIVVPIYLCRDCFAALRIALQKEKARLAVNLKNPDTKDDTKVIIDSYKNGRESELQGLNFVITNRYEGPIIRKENKESKEQETKSNLSRKDYIELILGVLAGLCLMAVGICILLKGGC